MRKYKILFDYGAYEGCKFQDEEFTSVRDAVKHAVELNYATKFYVVEVIDWEASQKCSYADCQRVHYKECPIYGVNE